VVQDLHVLVVKFNRDDLTSLTSVTDVGGLPAAVHGGDAEPGRRCLRDRYVCRGDVGEKTAPTRRPCS
jgi:hypothetical protein